VRAGLLPPHHAHHITGLHLPPPAHNRQGYIQPATLAEALQTCTNEELWARLQAIVGFLGLPDPLSRYMPPPDALTVRQVGVLRLGALVLAREAVDSMLDSLPLTRDPGMAGYDSPAVAVFCVLSHVLEDDELVEDSFSALRILEVPTSAVRLGRDADNLFNGVLDLVEGDLTTLCPYVSSQEGMARTLFPLLQDARAVGEAHALLGAPLATYLDASVLTIPTGCATSRVGWAQAWLCWRGTHGAPVWLVHW
jgi:hypothetical protein